ncbi:MAG: 4Fe-4S binding protein [Solirubrobacterales bacterium]
MTYVITEPCLEIMDHSCTTVCPVDCIHRMERILIIDPEACIDCGACVSVCPVEAIYPEADVPEEYAAFKDFTAAYPDREKIDQMARDYIEAAPYMPPPPEGNPPLPLPERPSLEEVTAAIAAEADRRPRLV